MLEGQALAAYIGRTLGGYRVVRPLSSDQIGALCEGAQAASGRRVTLRLFHPYLSNDAPFRERFDHLLSVVAGFSHPNLLRTLDFGIDGDLYYIVTEYLDGAPLRRALDSARPVVLSDRIETAALVIPQVVNGLAYLHEFKHAHGDVTPLTIVQAADGRAVLVDLGLAALVGGEDPDTGLQIRTPEYMAPEQIEVGQPVGPAADIYSLAIVAYELLLGQPPFSGTPATVRHGQLEEPPPAPSSLIAGFPAAAEPVLMRALAKEPAMRYVSVDTFAGDLLLALPLPRQRTTTADAAAAAPPAPPADQATPSPEPAGPPVMPPMPIPGMTPAPPPTPPPAADDGPRMVAPSSGRRLRVSEPLSLDPKERGSAPPPTAMPPVSSASRSPAPRQEPRGGGLGSSISAIAAVIVTILIILATVIGIYLIWSF
jgi:serine/threonine-protein kinase